MHECVHVIVPTYLSDMSVPRCACMTTFFDFCNRFVCVF